MVEYDPTIRDEWRRKGIIKERGRTIQVTKKGSVTHVSYLEWHGKILLSLVHMCGFVCLSISSLLTAE